MSAITPESLRQNGARAAGRSTLLWLLLMVVLWGLSWPATKLALDVTPPLWLAAIRFGSAGLCLFAFVALRGQLRLPARQDLPIVASVGIMQMMVFTGLGMIAMRHTDTSHAVLLAYTTPLWGILSSWLLLKQAPTGRQLTALLTGLAGIALICSPWEMRWSDPGVLMGATLLIIGAISWSLVIVHVRHHRWHASPLSLAPWQMLLAAVPLALIAWGVEGPPAAIALDSRLLWLLLFIGPVATSLCFVISSEHGRRVSVFTLANITLGVPLIGAVSAVVFLHNTLSTLYIVGLLLIFSGVMLTTFSALKK